MCFASSHVGNALPVLSTVFAFSMSTLVCAQNSLPTWDTSAFAYLPSKQASASLCNFSSRCARRRLRTIVFEKGSKAEGRCVSLKRERVRVWQATRQVCGVWLLVHVKCVGVSRMHGVDGRCGWMCDLLFFGGAVWVQAYQVVFPSWFVWSICTDACAFCRVMVEWASVQT